MQVQPAFVKFFFFFWWSSLPGKYKCKLHCTLQVTQQGMLYTFNPISGAATEGTPDAGEVLPYSVQQATVLHQTNENFLHPILILDTKLEVHAQVFVEVEKKLRLGTSFLGSDKIEACR